MRVTGETAVRLAEKYGLPIHKLPDGSEGYREDIALEDAKAILRGGDPEAIFTEAEPELVSAVTEEMVTGVPVVLVIQEEEPGAP